ncbi:type IX secretion system protein PorG [Croceiramulus getboli]|nr:DUF6089 family protein [Flavobacteriaceae bacterium YJPT1-3]
MKYTVLAILFCFSAYWAPAQTYEIGLYGGASNFIGDVGATNYIAPNQPLYGGILKWNRSKRHSFRFTAIFTSLEANDLDSDESRRVQRGYTFENNITELSLGLEFTFLEFDMYDGRRPMTPYLYSGLTYFNHDELVLNTANELVTIGSSWDFALPVVLGFKMAVADHWVLAVEGGARYTFTDNLDGSAPDAEELPTFGNLSNNDWYFFTGLTITYSFGRQPCYCGF